MTKVPLRGAHAIDWRGRPETYSEAIDRVVSVLATPRHHPEKGWILDDNRRWLAANERYLSAAAAQAFRDIQDWIEVPANRTEDDRARCWEAAERAADTLVAELKKVQYSA